MDERLLLDNMAGDGFEQVVFCSDRQTGLRAIIAIHDTTLGPALGGVRMRPYVSQADGLADVLRLARAMTYKAAAAGVNLGGGKSVIFGDPETEKTEALLRAHGRFIQTLGGRYVPGIDVGTEQADMEVIACEATHVSCIGPDPSPMTALGAYEAIRAGLDIALGTPDLAGRRVAVQGVGHVGSVVAKLAAKDGAEVTVSDVRESVAAGVAGEIGARLAAPDEIMAVDCDVLAPCALGGVISAATVPALSCRVVAGAANNILDADATCAVLEDAGIVFVPDYVANAGGIIFLEEQMLGHDGTQTERRIRAVGAQARRVLEQAAARGVPAVEAAAAMAEERLESRRHVGPPYVATSTQAG